MVLTRGKSSTSTPLSNSAQPKEKLRIGILITEPKLEQTKEELVGNSKMMRNVCPWLPEDDNQYMLERKYKNDELKTRADSRGKYGVPGDIAVGYYVKHNFKNVDVDFILPHEISLKRLQSNNLNFLMIYDILEAFHTDKSEGKKVYNTLKRCLKKAGNIYPPLEYQELVYSKIKYYRYMQEHNINIAPTLTMTAAEYRRFGKERAVQKVLEHVQAEKWDKFIAKPVYGQESKDVKFFTPGQKKSLDCYLSRCMAKYPGIVMQKAIPNFGDRLTSPELRMFFCGGEYKYSACCSHKDVTFPTSEGGRLNAPMDKLKPVIQEILKKLPDLVMPNGTKLPRWLDRLDMGYKVDGRFEPFVNELEFVPSLYVENIPPETCSDMISSMGKQMVNITKIYVKKPAGKATVRGSSSRVGVKKNLKKAGA